MVSLQVALESPLDIRRYSHTVADLDGTLVDGRIAQGQGVYFLKDELIRGHVHHVLLGATNYGRVKKTARIGEAEGLQYFFFVVGRTDCARRHKFEGYAGRYIKKHSIPGAIGVMLFLGQEMDTFISTIGSDIAAGAATEFYGCDDYIANPLRYSGPGRIEGASIKIRDGKDKLEATREMLASRRLQLSNGIMIGNDRYDHDLMKASALAVASPLADEETKELVIGLKGIVATDYESLLNELDHV